MPVDLRPEARRDLDASIKSRQFSVRDLLVLTSVVSLILTVAVLCRDSHYFRAFASPWSAVSLLPVVVVGVVYRLQLAGPSALAIGSILLFSISLAVPAALWGDEVMFGWLAWLESFVGLQFFHDRHIDGGWLFRSFTIPVSIPIACAIGSAANVAYLLAVAAYWVGRTNRSVRKLSHRASILAVSLAALILIPLCLTGDLSKLYAGYGLWVASMLALALGTRR